jgi:lipoprotein-releasing system permease protein
LFSKVERLISSRNLKPKKKEGFLKVISIFSFLGITLGVSILIIVMSVMNGFRIDLTDRILGFNPHITIKPYSSEIKNKFKVELKKKYKEFTIIDSLSGEAVIMLRDGTKGVLTKGINKNSLPKDYFLKNKLIEGNFEELEKNSIIIGKELALDLDAKIDDKINILSSSMIDTPLGSIPKQELFIIKGIFHSGFYEFDRNVVFIDLDKAIIFFNKSEKDLNLEIYIKEALNADLYKNEIQKMDENNYVYSWSDLNKSFFQALKVERNVMFIILTLIIIVAAFNIISGLTILIKNKTKEIAILKTLGLSNRSITKSFFLTGFTIGVTATVVGTLIGIFFSIYIENIRYFISIIFNFEIFPQDIYFLDEMPSDISPLSVCIIFIFSISISALASFLPAQIVSRMNIVKALKYE